MNFLTDLGWLGKSIIGMVCIIPLMLMFNFFGKNYGVKSEALMFGWFLGVAIGIAVSVWKFKIFNVSDLYTPFLPVLCIVLIGILIGILRVVCSTGGFGTDFTGVVVRGGGLWYGGGR